MFLLDNLEEYSKDNAKVAQVNRENIMTYAQLEGKSNSLANYFLSKTKQDKPIIIYGHKDDDILTSMIAALKTKKGYIPIDITFPKERVMDIIDEVEPEVIINFTEVDIQRENSLYLTKNTLKEVFSDYPSTPIDKKYWVDKDDLCYILFTSGSTGKPKGVQITRRNIESFVNWFSPQCLVNEEDCIFMNQISYSFDVSVISIYIGLTYGKTLFVLDKTMSENYSQLFSYMKKSNVKLWISTPSFAEICIQDDSFNKELLPNLKTMIFAGEVLSKELINTLKSRFGNIKIINGYGPTEATVLITATEITDEMLKDNRSIPIGYPIDNCDLKIVDENDTEVQEGEKGQLIVAGESVSIGYFNRKDITEKCFYYPKWSKGALAYKTGDLCYRIGDLIYYCGRMDFQVKLHGYRIELEDIESNLRKIPLIRNAVVLPIVKDDKIAYLSAAVILKEKSELSNLKTSLLIKEELKKSIPSYMVPRKIQVVEAFPINTNGKVDRKKLAVDIK